MFKALVPLIGISVVGISIYYWKIKPFNKGRRYDRFDKEISDFNQKFNRHKEAGERTKE